MSMVDRKSSDRLALLLPCGKVPDLLIAHVPPVIAEETPRRTMVPAGCVADGRLSQLMVSVLSLTATTVPLPPLPLSSPTVTGVPTPKRARPPLDTSTDDSSPKGPFNAATVADGRIVAFVVPGRI